MMCYMYIHVKLALPTCLGARSMAGLLGQPLECLVIVSLVMLVSISCARVVHFPSAFNAYCSLIMYSQIIEIAEVIQHQK